MPSTLRKELPKFDATPAQVNDAAARDAVLATVRGLSHYFTAAPGPLVEMQDKDNAILLLTGEHGGLKLTKAGTRVDCCPGVKVTRRSTITADCRIHGAHFASKAGGDSVGASLLDIANGCTVFLVNCHFERRAEDKADWLTIAAGCKVHLIGCIFTGKPTTGDCIVNPGLAANVGFWGANLTGRPLGANLTTVFAT